MTTELGGPTPRAQELLAPEVGSSHVRDNINYAVQRLIIQCGALLRQQIERAGRTGNQAVSEAEVDKIMFQFQAASAQLESMISNQVTAFALERIGQVLEHALNDGKDALNERALRSSQRIAAPRQSAPAIAAQPREPVPAVAAAGPGAPVTEPIGKAERGYYDNGAASDPNTAINMPSSPTSRPTARSSRARLALRSTPKATREESWTSSTSCARSTGFSSPS